MCGIEKPISFFSKHKNGKFGVKSQCKICKYEYSKEYDLKNREKYLLRKKRWYINGRDSILTKRKKYYIENKDVVKAKNKKYYIENKVSIVKVNGKYGDIQRKTILGRIKHNIKSRLNLAFKGAGWTKSGTSKSLLGVDFETLKDHIEKLFTKGMSLDKIGKEIHIDHIIPLSSAKTEEELITLCHYTNLQPLWAKDNLSKGRKILPVQMSLTI